MDKKTGKHKTPVLLSPIYVYFLLLKKRGEADPNQRRLSEDLLPNLEDERSL